MLLHTVKRILSLTSEEMPTVTNTRRCRPCEIEQQCRQLGEGARYAGSMASEGQPPRPAELDGTGTHTAFIARAENRGNNAPAVERVPRARRTGRSADP